jgi:6-pyruvoyltetrahydropterin/6-carboxytetrahydropterin synthase
MLVWLNGGYLKMEITKEFKFDMAHRLDKHGGKCASLHGHTYFLHITFKYDELDKIGVGIDFGDIKKIVNEKVINILDHSIWLKDSLDNIELITVLKKMKQRLILTQNNPTAENMIKYIKYLLSDLRHIFKIRLYETPTSYVDFQCSEYFNPNSQFKTLEQTHLYFFDENGKVKGY